MQLLQASIREGMRVPYPVVLVVEDYPSTQHVLSCVLELQKYQPVCVANGQEALAWIENSLYTEQYPAAILLDLLMPVMDGAHFLACLRARLQSSLHMSSPPIILLTADRDNHDELACTDILRKPFHIRDLLEKLSRAISNEGRT